MLTYFIDPASEQFLERILKLSCQAYALNTVDKVYLLFSAKIYINFLEVVEFFTILGMMQGYYCTVFERVFH